MILGLQEDIFLNRLLFEAFEYKTKKSVDDIWSLAIFTLKNWKFFPWKPLPSFQTKNKIKKRT